MLSRVNVVVVSGLPCSGKSTLAEHLRLTTGWQLLAKDAFKESLFASHGIGGREWSRKLSVEAYELLFSQALNSVRSSSSCIIEGNFRAGRFEGRFAELAADGGTLLQAHCFARADVLIRRFHERMPMRHIGHVDAESAAEIESEMRSDPQRPLLIDAPLVECDSEQTADWYVRATDQIQEILRR